MGKTYHTLDESQVSIITKKLAPDIIMSPVLNNMDVFKKLYINVIEDVEFEQSQFVLRRKGGTARRYKQGSTLSSKVGYMEESVLRTEKIWDRYFENLTNFREKEPFSTLGANQTYNAPVSEFLLRRIAEAFALNVLSNSFFGKMSLGIDSGMGMYDGYWTKIDQLINSQRISKSAGNLVDMTPINGGPETEKGENYDSFVEWVDGWHPSLRNAEHVVVYMSPKTKRLIVESYMAKFTGFQKESNAESSFRLFGMDNIELVSHAIIGDGNRMFATVPHNLEFGLDKENDWNKVMLSHDPNDMNNLIFQVQSNAGVRILDISASKFCVNNGSIQQIEQLNGDYQKDTLTVTSNNEEMGKVEVSPSKDEYTEGETVTLTATAEEGHHFVKWSDGATLSPRSLVYSGYPTTLQAIFEKDEE